MKSTESKQLAGLSRNMLSKVILRGTLIVAALATTGLPLSAQAGKEECQNDLNCTSAWVDLTAQEKDRVFPSPNNIRLLSARPGPNCPLSRKRSNSSARPVLRR